MATSIKLKGDIKKIEAAIKSKATPKSLVPKLEAQLSKIKSELASLSSAKPKKGVTKTKVLTALQKLKAKIKSTKSLSGYKRSGIDIEKDADIPALPLGRRISKQTGNPYYEYRLNRADVKQPPKRYPKLADGGMMAKGGIYSSENLYIVKVFDGKSGELLDMSHRVFARNLKEADRIAKEDFEDEMKGKYGDYLRFRVEEAPQFAADGGMMAKGFKYGVFVVSEDGEELGHTFYSNNPDIDDPYGDDVPVSVGSNQIVKRIDEDGGMMAKGGIIEHGLKVGDLITFDSISEDNTIEVKNKYDDKSYRVNLNEGTRVQMKSDGGRTLSAINRDRAYKSNQPWEQNYQRKSRPKNPKYQSSSDFFEEGGEMHRLFDEGEA